MQANQILLVMAVISFGATWHILTVLPDFMIRLCFFLLTHTFYRLEVRGAVGTLAADLLHYSNDSIDQQLSKIAPYSADFVRHRRQKGLSAGVTDLTIRPAWRFFRAYVLKRGFLDGYPGFYIAHATAFGAFVRYSRLYEEENQRAPHA